MIARCSLSGFTAECCPKERRFETAEPKKTAVSNRRSLKRFSAADHDDRVVPAHNFKYAAALQAAQGGDNPILIRIDTKSGHGASSTTKTLEQQTDIYSFLFQNLGVTPKW